MYVSQIVEGDEGHPICIEAKSRSYSAIAMRAGCVFRFRLWDLGELTWPPQRARMHGIYVYQNLQNTAAWCMTS